MKVQGTVKLNEACADIQILNEARLTQPDSDHTLPHSTVMQRATDTCNILPHGSRAWTDFTEKAAIYW